MPNAVALMNEYAPKRLRGTMVALMFSGYSVGGMVAAGLGIGIIPGFGWQPMFFITAIPLLLLPLILWKLPESPGFLSRQGHGRSSAPPAPYDLADLGRDMIALWDALSIARSHFCGLSLGGLTGQWLAIHAGARLDRIAVCATAARIGTAEGWAVRIGDVRARGLAHLVPRRQTAGSPRPSARPIRRPRTGSWPVSPQHRSKAILDAARRLPGPTCATGSTASPGPCWRSRAGTTRSACPPSLRRSPRPCRTGATRPCPGGIS